MLGTVFGILGSLSLSLYSIFTKKLLPSLNQDVWLLSYYNNIYSSILFFVLMVLNGELGELHRHYKALDTYFWLIMSVGGLCGFAVGIATSLQIKVCPALYPTGDTREFLFVVHVSADSQRVGYRKGLCANRSGLLLVR